MKGLMGWALAGAVMILLLVAMQALIPGGVTAIWTWFFNKMKASVSPGYVATMLKMYVG